MAYVNNLPPYKRKGLHSPGKRTLAFFLRIFLKKDFRRAPFAIQLRRRLELLGPTYIKLGQLMSIREDIFPRNITDELKKLLDQAPEVPFTLIEKIIQDNLGAPLDELFIEIKKESIGSASIGQAHRATTRNGHPVVIKVIKPGIRETILSDLKLLQFLSDILEFIIPRYQPKVVIDEFCRYTQREIDLTFEADHAEIFAANFSRTRSVVFPKIYRELSTRDVLCMEYIRGIKPTDPALARYSPATKKKIIDIGTGAIIKMLFDDGFFHADMHAANIVVMPGPKIGFVDLGMVGRFDEKIKRNMLYYFYSLVSGDVERATKHLLSMARIGKGADPAEFKRAVSDLLRRYLVRSANSSLSMAQVILESVGIAGKYRIFFPVEMTLMVKALITYEGVGRYLQPDLKIPELSKKHITKLYAKHYSPEYLWKNFQRSAPELFDVLMRLPGLLSDSSRFWDESLNQTPPESPLAGLRGSLVASACIVGGVLALVQGASPILWGALFGLAGAIMLFSK